MTSSLGLIPQNQQCFDTQFPQDSTDAALNAIGALAHAPFVHEQVNIEIFSGSAFHFWCILRPAEVTDLLLQLPVSPGSHGLVRELWFRPSRVSGARVSRTV